MSDLEDMVRLALREQGDEVVWRQQIVEAATARGHRAVRRRTVAVVTGIAGLVIAVVVGAAVAAGGPVPRTAPPPANGPTAPTPPHPTRGQTTAPAVHPTVETAYVVHHTLWIEGKRVSFSQIEGAKVRRVFDLATADGDVLMTTGGAHRDVVRLSAGGHAEILDRSVATSVRVSADGSRAAWLRVHTGEKLSYTVVVFDLDRAEVVATHPLADPFQCCGGGDAPNVIGFTSDGSVWINVWGTIARWRPDRRAWDQDAIQWGGRESPVAAAGRIVALSHGDHRTRLFTVGPDGLAEVMRDDDVRAVSPDGTRLVVLDRGRPYVRSVGADDEQPLDLDMGAGDGITRAAWDGGKHVLLAVGGSVGGDELVRCAIAAGSCERLADERMSEDDFVFPSSPR